MPTSTTHSREKHVVEGRRLSLAELLEQASHTDGGQESSNPAQTDLRHSAADNAATVRALLAQGDGLYEGWRFGILQTVDDYTSSVKRGGVALGHESLATSQSRRAPANLMLRLQLWPTISLTATAGVRRAGQ